MEAMLKVVGVESKTIETIGEYIITILNTDNEQETKRAAVEFFTRAVADMTPENITVRDCKFHGDVKDE